MTSVIFRACKAYHVAYRVLPAPVGAVIRAAVHGDRRGVAAVERIRRVHALIVHEARLGARGAGAVILLVADGHYQVVQLAALPDGAAGIFAVHLAVNIAGAQVLKLPVLDEYRPEVHGKLHIVIAYEFLRVLPCLDVSGAQEQHVPAGGEHAGMPDMRSHLFCNSRYVRH